MSHENYIWKIIPCVRNQNILLFLIGSIVTQLQESVKKQVNMQMFFCESSIMLHSGVENENFSQIKFKYATSAYFADY